MSTAAAKYENDMHMFAGSYAAFITVFICFFESFQRIRNVHLKMSITLFAVLSLLDGAFIMIATRCLSVGNLRAAKPLYIVASILWVACWLQVTYHTSYRAAQIIFTGYKRLWIFPIVVCICQGALSGTGCYFFVSNFLNNLGRRVDPKSVTITIVESFWYSIVETVLFGITQYRIVHVHSRVKKVSTSVKLQLYMKAVTRSILYSFNVTMMFLSVGNVFGADRGINSNWTAYGKTITVLILLTDSDRFQETIAVLTGTTDWERGTRLTTPSTDESAKDVTTANSAIAYFGHADLAGPIAINAPNGNAGRVPYIVVQNMSNAQNPAVQSGQGTDGSLRTTAGRYGRGQPTSYPHRY
ncbi:hypothetical protein BJ742DRAFT_837706 [Cladochytrium replicatum]|nr:hypothetical protein BJ742DRAFT_837706 [Cladochytrium replicatum]